MPCGPGLPGGHRLPRPRAPPAPGGGWGGQSVSIQPTMKSTRGRPRSPRSAVKRAHFQPISRPAWSTSRLVSIRDRCRAGRGGPTPGLPVIHASHVVRAIRPADRRLRPAGRGARGRGMELSRCRTSGHEGEPFPRMRVTTATSPAMGRAPRATAMRISAATAVAAPTVIPVSPVIDIGAKPTTATPARATVTGMRVTRGTGRGATGPTTAAAIRTSPWRAPMCRPRPAWTPGRQRTGPTTSRCLADSPMQARHRPIPFHTARRRGGARRGTVTAIRAGTDTGSRAALAAAVPVGPRDSPG
jgi:hypothetical protein